MMCKQGFPPGYESCIVRSMENGTAQDAGTEAVADDQTRGKIDRALPRPKLPHCQAQLPHASEIRFRVQNHKNPFSKIKIMCLIHIHKQAGPCRRVSQACIPQMCTHGGVYLVDVHLTYTGVHLSHKRAPRRSIRYAPITYTPMRCTLMTYTLMAYTPMKCTPVRCTFMRYTPMRYR
jgi:hypothetical protein